MPLTGAKFILRHNNQFASKEEGGVVKEEGKLFVKKWTNDINNVYEFVIDDPNGINIKTYRDNSNHFPGTGKAERSFRTVPLFSVIFDGRKATGSTAAKGRNERERNKREGKNHVSASVLYRINARQS